MLKINVPEGAIFYGRPRRRQEVIFDEELRLKTETAALRLHDMIMSGKTPAAIYEPKCDSCSLFDLCLPKLSSRSGSAQNYVNQLMAG
jgi:CRISPR-associated exonuclease Cas4